MSGFRASGSWRPGIQRDGAERESTQVRTVFPGGLAPARRRLDGQDGQRPVDHPVLRGPSAQRLDDVGDVVRAGVRPLVSLPRPRAVQLNLETRPVQALVIRVAASGDARFSGGIMLHPVAGGTPIERCCHLRLLLEEPDAKTALPLRPGRAVAVNA
jgi:hypothetical protein